MFPKSSMPYKHEPQNWREEHQKAAIIQRRLYLEEKITADIAVVDYLRLLGKEESAKRVERYIETLKFELSKF